MRTILSKVVWVGRGRALAIGVAVSMALALYLLALVAVQPAGAAFPGNNGKIAFERGTKIWMKPPSLAAEETRLRAETTSDSQPAFSPDGSRVAFMRSNEIYVANADGTGTPRNLTNSPLLDWNPAWSHDGTRIVFQRRGSDNAFNIWTMRADGTGTPTQVTTDGLNTDPAWSVPTAGAPDGKIIYRHSAAELWTMNADGTGKDELVFTCPNTNGGVCDRSIGIPTFSPDGTRVAFDYSGDIYWTYSSGVDPNTGLTPAAFPILRSGPNNDQEYPGDEKTAAWSPDGTKIAFEHNGNVAGSQYAIYTANADGTSTQATRITSPGAVHPDWQQDSVPPSVKSVSPTGKRVSPRANATATFSEAMNPATLDGATFKLVKKGTTASVPARITYSAATTRATLNPANNLRAGTTYRATLTAGASDVAGNRLAANRVWTFTVTR